MDSSSPVAREDSLVAREDSPECDLPPPLEPITAYTPLTGCQGVKGHVDMSARRKLWLVSILCSLFMITEFVGGYFAHSLAIMTDAAHIMTDLAGFLISIFSIYLAQKAPTHKLSFGFQRAEILGALISIFLIWLLTGILVYEAILRFMNPQDVDGKLMFILASVGLGINIAMGLILKGHHGHGHSHGFGGHGHSHGFSGHDHDIEHGQWHSGDRHEASPNQFNRAPVHEENINVRAAYIHVLGDALQSIGVMIAGAIIWVQPNYHIADPICTCLFSILVLWTTWTMLKQTLAVLMEGTPEGIDPTQIENDLKTIEGVQVVHDLHIWSTSIGHMCLCVHLTVPQVLDGERILNEATRRCSQNWNIHHTTIQIEKHNCLDLPPLENVCCDGKVCSEDI